MKNTILDYKIFEGELESISLNNSGFINTINPHSYVVAKKDKIFRKALLESDVLLPDGIGIVNAVKILRSKRIKKIAGNDIFTHLMGKLNDIEGSCFFLGSSKETLSLIKKKASKQYPNVKVSSFSPPFKKVFSDEDNIDMLSMIDKVKPDVLFVGMTAPKQEKWVYKNKDSINSELVCCIGAVFDFYAGTTNRPHKFWINLGLEWLVRLIKNPKHLWKRTFISTPIFIRDVLVLKLKNKR